MSEVDLLAGVLSKTGDVIEGVGADQLSLPTPCDDYDVEALVNHIVGWLLVFEAGAQGRSNDADAANHRCGADPAREFRAAAAGVVEGWEKHGFDRQVTVTGGKMPGEAVFSMTLMEYLTHGWDLAVATGQPIPYTDREAAETLARAEATLPPQYRGENLPFGQIVPVDADASAVDRLVAFLGRRPVPTTAR
ncbi:TIGR03086 family metal-binding protein [Streptomyces atratus]|uniref:TIGR03086 family metal-binding protein n=1 Tax=Streptomyces atratus TaxID=1893 RepID=UPI001671891D|nr:TIGR03086 family metal-binding protein [Streptomyces atratus]WPW31998.1 TIGR03086 family metal-binding protein [Streptomyces atratus]GGT18967.1 TIGR03086 family protein [Streptomyces atratus]